MSLQAYVWAWAQKDVTTNEKMVLLALADRHNSDTGECWPSNRRLAEDTRLSEPSIKKITKALAERGLISKEERRTPSGRHTSNMYRLHIPKTSRDPQGDKTDGYPIDTHEGYPIDTHMGSHYIPLESTSNNLPIESIKQNPTSGIDSKKEFWDTAIGTMAALNVAESTARGIIGRALALAQGDFSAVMKLLDAALMANPKNPAAYILGALQKGSGSPKLKITPEMQKINDEYMEKYKDHYNGTHNTTGSIGSDNGPVQPQPHAEPNDLSGPSLESFDELPAGGVNQVGGPARGYLDSLQVSADNSGSRRSGRKINEKAF